jgi:uncharacterized protein (TIGR01777 family)
MDPGGCAGGGAGGGLVKVVIAGGTGTLGRRIAADAARLGHEVVILTRSPRADLDHRQVEWDGRTAGAWAAELDGAVLVNLAGALVDRRPSRRNIDLLRRSRVEPTRALVQAAATRARRPALWVQMSTLAIYGDAGQDLVDESHPPADGPMQMAGVARPWEDAARDARADRIVVLRTGIVLDRGAPAVERLARLVRLGLGGRIGRGEQWVSWLHIDDFLAALWFVCDRPDLRGVVHLTAPEPVQNRDMMAAWRSALHRPWSPPTPAAIVHLGAFLMGSDPALALTGRRGVPRRLLAAGFTFEHPTFAPAIAALLDTDAGSRPPSSRSNVAGSQRRGKTPSPM